MTVLPAFATTTALGYVFPGRPNCPWANPSNSWVKYINQEYGDKNTAYFSIHFIRHIGYIEGCQCYTVRYLGNENWDAVGKIRDETPHTSKDAVTHGGDPTKSEINVWDARFTFNTAGEVFYVQDGQLAGNMYCHLGSECWK
jgi:hypothetical protein